MSVSQSEKLAQRIYTICADLPLLTDKVWRDRDIAFTRDDTLGLVIELDEENTAVFAGTQRGNMGTLDVTTVELCLTFVSRSNDWQTALDTVRSAVHTALSANADIAELVAGFRRLNARWQSKTADVPFSTLAQRYQAQFATPYNQT